MQAMCVKVWIKNGKLSEMTHSGLATKSCFFDSCKESERVVIMRYKENTKQLTKAIEKCKSLEDATYDAEFIGNKRIAITVSCFDRMKTI